MQEDEVTRLVYWLHGFDEKECKIDTIIFEQISLEKRNVGKPMQKMRVL